VPVEALPDPAANAVVPKPEKKSVQMFQDGKVHGAVCLARNTMTQYAVNPHSVIDERVVMAMVGLPARGKSYLSKAIVRCATRHSQAHFAWRACAPSFAPQMRTDHLVRTHSPPAAPQPFRKCEAQVHPSPLLWEPPAQVPELRGLPVAPLQRRVAPSQRRPHRHRRRLLQCQQRRRCGTARGDCNGDARRCAPTLLFAPQKSPAPPPPPSLTAPPSPSQPLPLVPSPPPIPCAALLDRFNLLSPRLTLPTPAPTPNPTSCPPNPQPPSRSTSRLAQVPTLRLFLPAVQARAQPGRRLQARVRLRHLRRHQHHRRKEAKGKAACA
jgi:hypothetical protein